MQEKSIKKGLAVLAAAALAGACHAVEVDGIAAQVDSATILKSDVVMEMRRAGISPDRYKAVLDEMIERKLILKAAGESKMTIQDWVVENRIRDIITRAFEGDRNRLMESLAQQKVSYPEWRQRLLDDMIVGAMRWQIVDKNVAASPTAMREEFANNPERYMAGGRTTVSVILLKPEDADRRDEVSAALKEKPFAEVAKEYSADTHAADGGVWTDVVPSEVFRPEVCKALADLPKGATGEWIDLDGWSFLLRKEDESELRSMTFAEAYDKIEANVREEAAAKAYADWIGRLKAKSYIKVFD